MASSQVVCFLLVSLVAGPVVAGPVVAGPVPAATTNIDDLIAVVQIFRHGQRAPVSFYANDPYSDESSWPVSEGQLTNTGKRQHYELGQFTRKRYDGFLPEQYNNDDFYARTTDVDRTHMSAQSNIAGIFPPKGSEIWNEDVLWQPIPIHAADEEIISGGPSCSIYSAETANVLVNGKEFEVINEEYADLFAYLTEYSGNNVTSASGVGSIYDALMIENQMGFELPEWTKPVFPEPMATLMGYNFLSQSYTDAQKRLMSGNWLRVVIEYFAEMFEDSSSSPKYQMWSAHDTNIASILNTLGAFKIHYPAFASTLYFELRNKSGDAVVNIWHRNDGVFEPVTISGCDFDCPLDNFETVLGPWLVNTTTWETECAASTTSLTDLSTLSASPELLAQHEEVVSQMNLRRPKNNPHSSDLP